MDCILSSKTELKHVNRRYYHCLKDTIAYYQDVCNFIFDVVEDRWAEISAYGNNKQRLTFVEELIHSTKNGDALYSQFDRRFYKLPSYYRRAAINFVLGQYSSFQTRLKQYNEERYLAISSGKHFKKRPPRLNKKNNAWPVLYKEVFVRDRKTVKIKVRIRNTWDWIECAIVERDYKDLSFKALGNTLGSPTLSYKFHKFYLTFPITYKSGKFDTVDLDEQIILSVDQGINRGAVCTLMKSDGTILGRFFDPFTRERDQIDHIINKLKKVYRNSGKGQSLSKIYTKLEGLKDNYVKQLARWIVDIAIQNNVYGIVLEHLSKMKGRGRHKDRIHHWCKSKIRDLIKSMALRVGIRTFFINPKNTSKLAFDGSGEVVRGPEAGFKNNKMCRFQNGKVYNCDLSASYNIGARYFLRELQKSISAKRWSSYKANVPGLAKRTTQTYSTLRVLCQEMTNEAAKVA